MGEKEHLWLMTLLILKNDQFKKIFQISSNEALDAKARKDRANLAQKRLLELYSGFEVEIQVG